MPSIRPFLRWAGSKRKLIPHLAPYWGLGHTRYLEPFMGSACLFFRLQPTSAVLSDTNRELIETFEMVRSHPDVIYDQLIALPRTEEHYYEVRKRNLLELSALERAVRFLYLNRNCFNGLYRTNTLGQYNVPFSGIKTGDYPSREDFHAAAHLLTSAELLHGDFENVLTREVRKGDFVYLDPPYAVENRRVFRQYGPHTFGLADLERLANLLLEIHNREAKFVLSYAECPEAINVFRRWNTRAVQTQRNISGFVQHRRKDTELLVTNFLD